MIHFYPKISVAIIKLASEVRQGDTISIEGHGKKFAQRVSSMQIEHAPVSVAKRGQSVGLKVAKRAKEGDVVFKA
ncbi:translation elongation factor-like protein [archaeon]|nr:translation elongation factor-like protein [archaeon]